MHEFARKVQCLKLKKLLLLLIFSVIAGIQVAATQDDGVRVSGVLSNIEGAPFNDPNSRVVLRNGNALAAISRIASDGLFEFTGIAPGTYSLSLSGGGFAISPIIPVRVEKADIRNLEMTVPRAKQVSGRVTLEGNGPLPKLQLLLKPLKDPSAKFLSPTFGTNEGFPGTTPITPLVDLTPRTDGTLNVRIPEGDWQVSLKGEFPEGYFITALIYGNTDILRNPMKVRLSDDAAIRLAVTNSSNRLSSVYGRITGLTPAMIARGPMSGTGAPKS
jgi:hypothetical protein